MSPKLKLFIVLIASGLFLITGTPTLACSGSPPSMDELLESGAALIKARVIERDINAQNYILQVESYIVGESAPAYIFLQLKSPGVASQMSGGYISIDGCSVFFKPLPDETFYMFVQRTPFGFYWTQIDRPGFRWHYAFSEDQPTVTFEENITEFEYDDSRAEYVSYDVDEAGFLAYFAAKTGSLPKPPLSDQLYPRKSLLLLISESGLRYLLPIDSNEPFVVSDSELSAALLSFPCEPRQWKVSLGCDTAFDPARLVPLDDFTGVQRYIDGEPERFVNNYGLPVAPGDTASFANTGEIAVWVNGHLTVYDAYAGQQGMARRLIEHSVSTPINGNIRQTAWSADGQQFAFSDSDGVWILSLADPIRLNRPVLLAPSGDPLHFSPDGKYLAIADQDSRYTIALETAEHLPYRIYAPDMNHFVELQDAALLDRTIEIAQRADHIAWKDSSTVILRTGSEISWFDLDGKKLFTESGSDFEIARSGEVIVLVDSNTLSIDQHTYSVELEGGIAEIRWMPPSWEYRWFCEFLC